MTVSMYVRLNLSSKTTRNRKPNHEVRAMYLKLKKLKNEIRSEENWIGLLQDNFTKEASSGKVPSVGPNILHQIWNADENIRKLNERVKLVDKYLQNNWRNKKV